MAKQDKSWRNVKVTIFNKADIPTQLNKLGAEITSYSFQLEITGSPDECVICGYDRVVESHHITPKKDGGSNKANNFITLCPNCHKLVHNGQILLKHEPLK